MSKFLMWIILGIAFVLIIVTAIIFYIVGQKSVMTNQVETPVVVNQIEPPVVDPRVIEDINVAPIPETERFCEVGGGWCVSYPVAWGEPEGDLTSVTDSTTGQPVTGFIASWKDLPGISNIAVLRNQPAFGLVTENITAEHLEPIGGSGLFATWTSYTDSQGINNAVIQFEHTSGIYVVTFKFDHAPQLGDDQIIYDFISSWTFN